MQTIKIEATKKTPFVILDPEQGNIEIKGTSINVNIMQFYEPILDWVEQYKSVAGKNTNINCRLKVYNTITSKVLIHIFKTLEKIPNPHKLVVNWYIDFEDADMREFGDDIRSILHNVQFNIIEDQPG